MEVKVPNGTAAENLELALREEQILRSLMPGDPYRRLAQINIDYYLVAAATLERRENTR